MKKRALIITNSNLFTVLSQSYLKDEYVCEVLNVRYANEEMSQSAHFIQQVKDLFDEDLYQRGKLFSKHEFSFTERFSDRLNEVFKRHKPEIIFFEMKTLDPSEWLTLEHIHTHYARPIIAFLPPDEDSDQVVLRLYKFGVKESPTKLDESVFRGIIRRNK